MTAKKQQWQLHGYNIIDLILLFSGLLAAVIPAIFFKSDWIIIINSILGIFCVFTQAKGKISSQFIGLAYFGFYITSSVFQAYWGEVIIYSLMMIPLYIYGAVEWIKNRDKKDKTTVIVRTKTSKKEYLLLALVSAALFVGTYFLLKTLNTAEVWFSTLALASIVAAVYLLTRRNKMNQFVFLFADLSAFVLWLIPVIQGKLELLPIALTIGFQAIYDVYGIFEWSKLEKQQRVEEPSN